MAKAKAEPLHIPIPEYVLKIAEQHFIILVMMSWARVTEIIDDRSMYPKMFSRFVDTCSYGWWLSVFCMTEERARTIALKDYAEDDPELDMALSAFKMKLELFPDDRVVITDADGDYNDGKPVFRLKFDTGFMEDFLTDGVVSLPKPEELADVTAIANALLAGRTTKEQMAGLAMLEEPSVAESEDGKQNI